MYSQRHRFLFALLCVILLCSSVQATNLQISVQDNIDNSSVPYATVFLNGGNIARTNTLGQVYLTHSGLNDLQIVVSKTGYDDWVKTVSRNETALLVNLSRKTLTLKVSLFDSDTLVPVSGALVNISAENVTMGKQTEISGSALFGVTASTLYSVNIEAANYQPRRTTIDMALENRDVQYWLLPGNRFAIEIKDKNGKAPLPDAEVRINSALVGKTDAKGRLVIPVTRGNSYTIEISKTGYQTYTESRIISDADAIYSVEITKAPIGAFIFVVDENRVAISGADVYINGNLLGSTNQYGRSTSPTLVSGTYPVEIRKAGYVTVSRPIQVSNVNEDYMFVMPFENAVLTLFVKDNEQKIVPNASIYVNGNVLGMTDDRGQYNTRLNFNTPYNITASKDGYQPASIQKQVVSGNATASATLTLEKSLDWGLIATIAAGIVGILVLFAVIRMIGHKRKRHHGIRRNEI
ncbi:MAG: carboxypeptidase regulatory-like domain-containing protein [Methanoregula sp.]|nr:carboxypeptidase regulatory-like domain-containing protein [Methanoregula sp.]